VNAPSTTWFLAEGATGPFFETFVLLANPGDTDATATLTDFPLGGTPINATKQVPAHARVTVNLEGESPALANAAVSTQVQSTPPILVERSQYWRDPARTGTKRTTASASPRSRRGGASRKATSAMSMATRTRRPTSCSPTPTRRLRM
jgi:hypothetical protein